MLLIKLNTKVDEWFDAKEILQKKTHENKEDGYYNPLIPSHFLLIFIVHLRQIEGIKHLHKELLNPTLFVNWLPIQRGLLRESQSI
jgi:hypothetical protein